MLKTFFLVKLNFTLEVWVLQTHGQERVQYDGSTVDFLHRCFSQFPPFYPDALRIMLPYKEVKKIKNLKKQTNK